MSQDFVTTLRAQLREAAEREARRGPLRRALPRPQPRAFALAGALAIAAAAIVIAVGTFPGHTRVPVRQPAPHVVARLQLADQGGTVAPGFGSLWVNDLGNARVLRVGADGGVIATIPIRGDLFDLWTGSGAVWVLTDERLYRIDPRSNRIAASILLPPPTRNNGGVFAGNGVMWVTNAAELLRVDPRTNRIDRRVSLERDGLAARGGASDPHGIYILRGDGRLETLDPRTGGSRGVVQPQAPGLPTIAADGAVLVANGAGVAALEPHTGHLRWRTNLGAARINFVTYGNGAVWAQGTPESGRDQAWRLNPRTGRVTAAVPLSDFGATGMATFAGRLWIVSPAGTVSVIR